MSLKHDWSDTNPSKCRVCGIRKRKDRPQNECHGKPEVGELSIVARSNLFTKAMTEPYAAAQAVEKAYTVPPKAVRELCARLLLEETLETIRALGVCVEWSDGEYTHTLPEIGNCKFTANIPGDLEGIIDGAADTIYVATGAMVACGVPDLPHLEEVCRANDSKFPDGQVKLAPGGGKYLKPLGWEPPNHKAIMKRLRRGTDLKKAAKEIVKREQT